MGCEAEVFLCVVEAVVVYMIDQEVVGGFYNVAVHSDLFFSLAASYSVEGVRAFSSCPLVS